MLPNSTEATTTVVVTPGSNYDHTGAMIYIVSVLLFYSVGIILMLAMQMRARSETIEEHARRRTKLVIRTLRDQTHTKEILEELVDKEKRARLWNIYLGSKTFSKEKVTNGETARIRHIEKQLATLNRNRRMTDDRLTTGRDEILYQRSRSDSRQITTENDDEQQQQHPSTLRRRSSFDQQTLERWKALANQSKTSEQDPWNIRQMMTGRYFRRHAKKPLSPLRQESNTINPTIDNFLLFTDQINFLTQHRSESADLDQINTDDEQQSDPYMRYFYPTSDRPETVSEKFSPVSSQHSLV